MPKRLSALDIAEGALLADIAVIFLLLALYLPVVGAFFQLLIPTVLAVLVLRRGLYVSALAACVALFLVCVTAGPVTFVPMLLPCGAGIFLGLVMRHRVPHWAALLLGALGGTLTLYALTLLLALLAGRAPSLFVRQIRGGYVLATQAAERAAAWVGLGEWWRQSLFPLIDPLAELLLAYWWAALFAALLAFAAPMALINYYICNRFVRMLGYAVRPFPGGRAEALMARVAAGIIRRGQRLAGLARRGGRA